MLRLASSQTLNHQLINVLNWSTFSSISTWSNYLDWSNDDQIHLEFSIHHPFVLSDVDNFTWIDNILIKFIKIDPLLIFIHLSWPDDLKPCIYLHLQIHCVNLHTLIWTPKNLKVWWKFKTCNRCSCFRLVAKVYQAHLLSDNPVSFVTPHHHLHHRRPHYDLRKDPLITLYNWILLFGWKFLRIFCEVFIWWLLYK